MLWCLAASDLITFGARVQGAAMQVGGI